MITSVPHGADALEALIAACTLLAGIRAEVLQVFRRHAASLIRHDSYA
jgi:hypothetical protein